MSSVLSPRPNLAGGPIIAGGDIAAGMDAFALDGAPGTASDDPALLAAAAEQASDGDEDELIILPAPDSFSVSAPRRPAAAPTPSRDLQIFAAPILRRTGTATASADGAGSAAGGGDDGSGKAALSAKAQKRIQDASADLFSCTRLSGAASVGAAPSGVVWFDTSGVHLNPTPASLDALDQAGINPADIAHVVLTEAGDAVVEGLVRLVLRRERIRVIAPPDIFAQAIARAGVLLNGAYDVGRWVDHVALPPDGEATIRLRTGAGAVVRRDASGQLAFLFREHALTQHEIEGLPPLASKRILPRDLAGSAEARRSYLHAVSLFSHLDERDIAEIMRESEVVAFAPGDAVVRRGDPADSAYVILSGGADVLDEGGKVVWSFHSRDFFGEVGIQSGQPRSATVTARTHLSALRISRDLYGRIISNPLRGSKTFIAAKYALEVFFRGIAPGIHLSEASLEAIALRTPREPYADGIREGDIGDSAYLLLDGAVEVTKSGGTAPLATLGPMSIFGEMALFHPRSRRTASVTAAPGPTPHVLRIDRELFEFILYRYPGVDHGIRRTMIERRRENRDRLFAPRAVPVPGVFAADGPAPADAGALLNRWRGFTKLFGIDVDVHDLTLGEFTASAGNIGALEQLLREIVGEPLLQQGVLERVRLAAPDGGDQPRYDADARALVLPRAALQLAPALFARQVLPALGAMTAQHLADAELLPEEILRLVSAAGTIAARAGELPAAIRQHGTQSLAITTEAEATALAGDFLSAYVLAGDEIRAFLADDAAPADLREALGFIDDLYRRLHFLGLAFSAAAPAGPPAPSRAATRARPAASFAPDEASRRVEEMLNDIFRRYASHDRPNLYRRIYEPRIFADLKLDLMRRLAENFPSFHLQKFTDDVIEVSVYDFAGGSRTVLAFSRARDGALYRWQARPADGGIRVVRGQAPITTMLVNLPSAQFGGVRGTPENILTIQAYLEKHRRDVASVSLYDTQWPENTIDALVEELKLNPPDVLGLSATFGTLPGLERLLGEVAHLERKPLVVVGGLLSTWNTDYLLQRFPDIIAVRFEGEEAMAQIIDMAARMPVDDRRRFIDHNVALLDRIPNIAFAHEGAVHLHRRAFVDLAAVPPPDRKSAIERQKPAGWLLNAEGRGRGCAYGACYFCTRTHGAFRFFPLERGLADFAAYMEAGVPFIVYVDEDFLPDDDPRAAQAFARSIIELKERHRQAALATHGTEPTLPSFYIAARAPSIYTAGDDAGNAERLEALRLLKQAGLVKIFLGAESGSEVQFHKTYHKGGSIAEVERAMQIIRGEGIQVVAGFITFDPVLTLDELRQDLEFMRRNGLVFVDPLTEPLNPFKYYRAQEGSLLARRLRGIGLISSSMDPDLLTYDSAYRNPLIRLLTRVGDAWKAPTAQLDYHLKGILWHAEQSPHEMERAARFVELFNQLKQADFALIEAIAEGMKGIRAGEAAGLAAFLARLEREPEEKVFFELRRMLFPHGDIVDGLAAYVAANRQRPGFDLHRLLTAFLAGDIPSDVDLGDSTADDYRRWLAEIRADIAQEMLAPAALAGQAANADRLLREALEKRQAILAAFAASDWQDYYRVHPESVRRGKEFERALGASMAHHAALLAEHAPAVGAEALAPPPFAIRWRASLGEVLDYRHPDPGRPISALIDALVRLAADPATPAAGLDAVFIAPDGALSFAGADGTGDRLQLAREAVRRLFLNGIDPFDNDAATVAAARAMYLRATSNGYRSLAQVIGDLRELYRLAARPQHLAAGGATISFLPASRDGRAELAVAGAHGRIALSVRGAHLASRIEIALPEQAVRLHAGRIVPEHPGAFVAAMTGVWRTVLDATPALSEQDRFSVINAIVEMLRRTEGAGDAWMAALADDIDARVAPMTVYLPDEQTYHAWRQERPGLRLTFLHPLLHDRIWPGVRPHLPRIAQLAHPEAIGDYGRLLAMLDAGELSPPWANFMMEVFYNRLSPKAFLRNSDPAATVREYTAIPGRLMPRKTPILLLPPDDPRVTSLAPAMPDAAEFLTAPDGRSRLVIHPQVYREWKASGRIPFDERSAEWGLVYPTSSARTLYVLGAGGDVIAKTHSLIWIGPARRHLTADNVLHSRRISDQIRAAIDAGELPASIRETFAFIDDSGGVVIEDPAFYPEKGSIGAIVRSTAAYPPVDPENRLLIPAFAMHNNAVNVPGNPAPALLVEILRHTVGDSGVPPVSAFLETVVRPLYRIFFYFMFKQGLLLEPHGQNWFLEVDRDGAVTRLVFKDWQSTMVDMETRIRRGLPGGAIAKHLFGQEADIPLSLSLVFDYYFSTYLFDKVVDTLVEAYHGTTPEVAYRATLIAELKRLFEEEVSIYQQRREEFPDAMVHHDKKPKDDTSNTVYFKIDGPPPFRPTSYERAIARAVRERRARGIIDVPQRGIEERGARVAPDAAPMPRTIDLERSRLIVRSGGTWDDARETERTAAGIDGAYEVILPERFDPARTYPLVVLLHGMRSDGSEVSTWADRIGWQDAIVVVPSAPFRDGDDAASWFRGTSAEDKDLSLGLLAEIVADARRRFPTGRSIVGGISQGGYMALHGALARPDLFDDAFAVNAPFAEAYLPVLPPPEATDGARRIRLFHLEGDQVVPAHHALRAEAFLRARGFDVRRTALGAGQHNSLSAAAAADLRGFLDDLPGAGPVAEVPEPAALAALVGAAKAGDAAPAGAIEAVLAVGRRRLPGYEGALYEAMLDLSQPLALRSAALTALEQLSFRPVFDLWEDTTLLGDFRDAGARLAAVERIVAFLASHIAWLGADALSEREAAAFDVLVSALRGTAHRFAVDARDNEAAAGRDRIGQTIREIEYLYETALDLQTRIIGNVVH